MRKIATALLVLLAVPAAASAQGRPMGGGMMGNLATVAIENRDSLALSAEQVSKLEILADSLEKEGRPLREEMAKVRESGGGREAMMPLMEKFRAHREAALGKVRAVLKQEQAAKFDAILATMRSRRGGGGSR